VGRCGTLKILYLSGGKSADYQCDIVMHGLRSLLGPDLVDINKMYFMYDTSWDYMFHSLYKLLPDIEVDRGDVETKIKSRYFDAVVYGSIHRCRDYMDLVLDSYPGNKIAFIDGEDGPELAPAVGHGWYFKRELYEPHPDVLPIQFGIPKEKIRPIDLSRKTRLMAHCDPRDRSTYVYYDSEQRYYDQYSDAYFGYTMKKGGWDCMRHVEIMAAGCMPYFVDFKSCPELTLNLFPKAEFLQGCELYDEWRDDEIYRKEYEIMLTDVRNTLIRDLTTEAIAKRILERVS
jgi:hypothetical protein